MRPLERARGQEQRRPHHGQCCRERDETLDQITVRDHQDCHSLSVAMFARPADQHEQKAQSKIPSSRERSGASGMSDPSERQSNDTAHQDPTHVSSTVGNGIADDARKSRFQGMSHLFGRRGASACLLGATTFPILALL